MPPANPRHQREHELYRAATIASITALEERRLQAIEHVTRDCHGNWLTQKCSFDLPALGDFADRAETLADALHEFVTIERLVDLAEWKSVRNVAPERRALMGETLLVRYHEEDQPPDIVAANRDHLKRAERRRELAEAWQSEHPEGESIELTKEQKAEVKWGNDGLRFRLRVDASRLPCGLDSTAASTPRQN